MSCSEIWEKICNPLLIPSIAVFEFEEIPADFLRYLSK